MLSDWKALKEQSFVMYIIMIGVSIYFYNTLPFRKMSLNLLDHFRSKKDFFELNMNFLFFVGLCPQKNMTKNKLFCFKIYQNTLHFLSVIFLLITGVKTYQIRFDTIAFLDNIDKSIAAYNYFMKVIFFLKCREELNKLIDEIILSGDQVKAKSSDRMINHLVLVTVFNSGVVMIFSIVGLYNGEMTIEAWMPFDAKKNRMNLALAAQILAVLFCLPFSYRAMGMQGILCSILIYLCDQLESLRRAIQQFQFSRVNERESRENFNKMIRKHIRLMRYSKSMKKMFKEYFLIQNLAVTVELCLNAMLLTMVRTTQKNLLVGFLAFLGLALLNAYIHCSLGNELITQSESIAFAAYSTDWTTWPLDMQKGVLLIIKAAQTPFHMTAGGVASVSMQTYATALYNGYSMFTVLHDVVGL